MKMTNAKLYCTECGAEAINKAKYCFKCGSPAHNPSPVHSEPYGLDDRFQRCISSSLHTNLKYSLHSRVWLLDGGFEKLHLFINELCNLVYGKSAKVSPSESDNQCYDTISEIHFPRYDTDFYPPDGHESVFVEFDDFIPSPFGNQGVREGATDFDRPMRIFFGRVEHDPDHGKNNVSETKQPRLRKSKLVEKWGISVNHIFIDRKPTLDFSYSLTAYALSWQDKYSPNYKGLLSVLGLEAVSGVGQYCLVKGKPVTSLTDVRKALSDSNGTIVYEPIHEEEWLPASKSWQPFVSVTVKSGWFSSEKRRLYLPAYAGKQRPPMR